MTALFLLFNSGYVENSGYKENYINNIGSEDGVHSSIFAKGFEDLHQPKIDECNEDIDSELEGETTFPFVCRDG